MAGAPAVRLLRVETRAFRNAALGGRGREPRRTRPAARPRARSRPAPGSISSPPRAAWTSSRRGPGRRRRARSDATLRPLAFERLEVSAPVASRRRHGHRRPRRAPGSRDAAGPHAPAASPRAAGSAAPRPLLREPTRRRHLEPEGDVWEPAEGDRAARGAAGAARGCSCGTRPSPGRAATCTGRTWGAPGRHRPGGADARARTPFTLRRCREAVRGGRPDAARGDRKWKR